MLDQTFLDTNLTLQQLGVRRVGDTLHFPFPVPQDCGLGLPCTYTVQPYAVGDKTRTPSIKNVIAVASGKGGVGKSTVAVNLAVALAKLGASVGILDGDVYGPSIPTMLGGSKAVIENAKIVPQVLHGVKVTSMGYLVSEATPMIWRGPMASGALVQLFTDTQWGNLDYLIIDLPPGTGDIQLSLAQKLPVTAAIVVTTPQDVALMDVQKALAMLQKVQIPVLGIVENMHHFACPHCHTRSEIFGANGGVTLAERFAVPLLAQLPLNIATRVAGDTAQPIALTDPQFTTLALHTLSRLALRPKDMRLAVKQEVVA